MIRAIGSPNRGVKTANFVVLRKTRHPAILIEGGFVSNKTDRNAMMDPRYRQAIVDSVAVDPHKLLFMPLEAGCVLVRDPQHLRADIPAALVAEEIGI